MSYQDNEFDYDAYARRDGKMSASNRRQFSQLQRPSLEELAQYNAVNYTNRKKKSSKSSFTRGVNRRFALIAVAIAVVLFLVIPGVALAVSAKNAMDDARTLMNQASALSNQIQSGDVAGAQRTASNFASVAKQLDENVNSLLWKPLVIIPVYGEDVRSVRKLAHVADLLSEQLLVPLTQALPADGNIRLFSDGAFNVPLMQVVLASVGNASATIQSCAAEVNARPDAHIAQLQEALVAIKGALNPLGEISGYAGDLSRMLPDMMGVAAPRTYLVVATSQAELRSVGGFPGSAGLMTVENGRIDIGDLKAPRLKYQSDPEEWFPLTDEERFLFGDHAAANFYDASYIPEFPLVAQVMKFMWEKENPNIDGIISIDVVFLQRMLEVIGSVTTSGGVVVDGSNAAQVLLRDVYVMYSSEALANGPEGSESLLSAESIQNSFFTEVASLALDNFLGNFSKVGLVSATQLFGEGIADKNLYMWMANPEEEELLKQLDAACSTSSSEENPELGVYLSTAVATKQDWYLDFKTMVGEPVKNADGSTSYDVTTRIANTMQVEEAATLPSIMTNTDPYVASKIRSLGDMIVDIYLFAPGGGMITNMNTEGSFAPEGLFDDVGTRGTRPGPDPMSRASYNGREVWYGLAMIEPQQETVISYTVTTSTLATAPLEVDTTPSARSVNR